MTYYGKPQKPEEPQRYIAEYKKIEIKTGDTLEDVLKRIPDTNYKLYEFGWDFNDRGFSIEQDVYLEYSVEKPNPNYETELKKYKIELEEYERGNKVWMLKQQIDSKIVPLIQNGSLEQLEKLVEALAQFA